MSRSALIQGGLLACFWTEAAPCVFFLPNLSRRSVHRVAGGENSDAAPYELVTGRRFDGASVPFGGKHGGRSTSTPTRGEGPSITRWAPG
eukprot:955833-Alexandrium_andersonii.AAC.1